METYKVYWKECFFAYVEANSPNEAADQLRHGTDGIFDISGAAFNVYKVDDEVPDVEVVDSRGDIYSY